MNGPAVTAAPAPAATAPNSPERDTLPALTPAERELSLELAPVIQRLAGNIGERHAGRKWQLADAIDYVALEFEAVGLSVDRQGYELNAEVVAQNLTTEIRGDVDNDEIVLVGAHLDSPPGSPGASAAAGVAAVIALGRRLRTTAPARTVRLVVFSLCEGDIAGTDAAGSRVYARAAVARGERIVAAIALDSLGAFSAELAQRRAPELDGEWSARGDFLALISAERDRAVLHRAASAFHEVASIPSASAVARSPIADLGASDSWGFAEAGIPTLRVTDTARLRNPAQGTAADLPNEVDLDGLARVVAGLEPMILALAGTDGPTGELRTDPATGRVVPWFE